jgi:hypothetical protein
VTLVSLRFEPEFHRRDRRGRGVFLSVLCELSVLSGKDACLNSCLSVTENRATYVARQGECEGVNCGLQQPQFPGPFDGIETATDAQFSVEAANVGFDGVERDHERVGNILVGQVRSDQA